MADIGFTLAAAGPAASQFVEGYTIGERLALEKEKGAQEIARSKADEARIGELTRGLKLATDETYDPIRQGARDAEARAATILSNLNALDRGVKLRAGEQEKESIFGGYVSQLKTAALKADQDLIAAKAAGDNQGIKLAMDKKKLLQDAADQETALATGSLAGRTALTTATTANMTEAEKLATAQVDQFVKSMPAVEGEDEYTRLGRAAQQLRDPAQQNAVRAKQRQAAGQGLLQAGLGGDPVEFVKQYNRLHAGQPRQAQLTSNKQIIIGETETIQDWSMTTPQTRIKPGTAIAIDTTKAEGMFDMARKAATAAGVQIPAGFMPGVEAQAAQREALAIKAAGGTATSNPGAVATSRGGGAPPVAQGPAPVVTPGGAGAAVAPGGGLETGYEAQAARAAQAAGTEQQAPALVAAKAAAQAEQQAVTIEQLMKEVGIQAPAGATTQEVAGIAFSELTDVQKRIAKEIAAPNTPTSQGALDTLYERKKTIEDLIAALQPPSQRVEAGPTAMKRNFRAAQAQGLGGMLNAPAPAPARNPGPQSSVVTPTATIGIRG